MNTSNLILNQMCDLLPFIHFYILIVINSFGFLMIFPTVINKKRQIFPYIFFLVVTISAFTLSPLFATDSFTSPEEGEDNNRKRYRNGNNSKDNNNTLVIEQLAQGEQPSKRQKPANTDFLTSILVDKGTGVGLWIPGDLVQNIFSHTFFKDIRAGRCVAKGWERILSDNSYVKSWGRFFPSTPQGMGATISEFIHYFETPSFTLLRDDRFRKIKVTGLSADGSALLARGFDSENNSRETAFRWRKGGISILPSLEDGTPLSWIISSDGSTLVAKNFIAQFFVKWKENNLTPIPIPPVCVGFNSQTPYCYSASDISGDGSTIIGWATDIVYNNIKVLFKCNTHVNMALPSIFRDPLISADGSTIVGKRLDDIIVQVKNDECTALPLSKQTQLTGISGDGSTIIAYDGEINGGSLAWKDGENHELPFLNGGHFSYPNATNGDGSRIVGQAHDGAGNDGSTATLWTLSGAYSIQTLLENAGVDLGGATLKAAEFISANGLQVVGRADLNEEEIYFIAVLPIEDPKANLKKTSN